MVTNETGQELSLLPRVQFSLCSLYGSSDNAFAMYTAI
jgi:hypothetical protein